MKLKSIWNELRVKFELIEVKVGVNRGYSNLLDVKMSLTSIICECDDISNSACFNFHSSF